MQFLNVFSEYLANIGQCCKTDVASKTFSDICKHSQKHVPSLNLCVRRCVRFHFFCVVNTIFYLDEDLQTDKLDTPFINTSFLVSYKRINIEHF